MLFLSNKEVATLKEKLELSKVSNNYVSIQCTNDNLIKKKDRLMRDWELLKLEENFSEFLSRHTVGSVYLYHTNYWKLDQVIDVLKNLLMKNFAKNMAEINETSCNVN